MGFDAITNQNGWAMALVGVSIVFSGLLILSLSIAQLHKVLDIWEKKGDVYKKIVEKREQKAKKVKAYKDLTVTEWLEISVKQFNILVQAMDDPFSLPVLLDVAQKRGLLRPHSALTEFLKIELIIPDGNGYYRWDKRVFRNILKKGEGQ
ncbi:MAG: OadG family protein [Proteobacteria bacterium]|nr:OadG family protein [Pseudomonadota bacterium]